MEFAVGGGQDAFSPELAAESLDYWRNTTQNTLLELAAVGSPSVLRSQSHNAVAAARRRQRIGQTAHRFRVFGPEL
jgi:hypothetical protein